MGTFASYIGKVSIPDTKKAEFNKNMIKLLQYGGMVNFDTVCLSGNEITLIQPVELNKEGECYFHYNYFEDAEWETAGFNSNTNTLWSEKIGCDEFNDVICAGYFLTELYSQDYGWVCMNGDVRSYAYYAQWINFILDKDFSLEKRFNLWNYYEAYVLYKKERGYTFSEIELDIFEFVPKGLEAYAGGTDLVDIMHIEYGTEEVPDETPSGAYAKEVWNLKKELELFYKGNGQSGKELIWQLIAMPIAKRKSIKGTSYDKLAELSTRIAARVFVYLSAEILSFSFWEEWENIYKDVYDDEITPNYVSDKVLKTRKQGRSESLGKMKTSEFLRNDGYFTFRDTPKEIDHKDNYYISDDDLMYWWDGSEKIQLSDGMIELISKWKQDYEEIIKDTQDADIDSFEMLKKLMNILDTANEYYKRIFAFSSMFYEFLENGKNKKYIAAIKLFEKVVEDNKAEGRIIKHLKNNWSMTSKNVTFNEGRVTIKRFLSLMANKKLRKIYFDF